MKRTHLFLWISFSSGLAAVPSGQRLERLREVLPLDAFGDGVQAVDLTGDGVLDLVGRHDDLGTIGRANDGAGNFSEVELPISEDRLFSIVVGDVTGDGLPDVLGGASVARLFVQWPAGTFTEDLAFPLMPVETALLDIEGDGDLDIVSFANAGSVSVKLWRNNGSGGFEEAVGVPPSTGSAPHLVVFDADGDGDDDVLLDRPVRLWRNVGGAFVEEPQPLHVVFASPFQAVDVEGDGDQDFVLQGGNWAENDGTGSFSGSGFLAENRDGAFLDFDSDGRMDLARPGPGGLGVELLRGVEPTQLVTVASPELDVFDGLRVDEVVAADFDGDGDPDLLVAADETRLLWGDGAGGWELALVAPERVANDVNGIWAQDHDGDEIVDGLGIQVEAGIRRFVWWQGLGGGAFEASRDVTVPALWVGAGAIDLENDGRLDAVLVSEFAARAYRFEEDDLWALGANAWSMRVLGVGPTVADVLVGDLDADGFEDAVVLSSVYGPTQNNGNQTRGYVLRNDGAGELVNANAALPNTILRGDLGDVDRDGDLDFVAYSVGGDISRYLNRGDGTFDVFASGISTSTNLGSPTLVDLDASGVLDLALLVDAAPQSLELRAGNGDGTFPLAPTVTLTRQSTILGPGSLATPDVDADGLVELYMPDGETGTFYANRGGFVFEDRSLTAPALPPSARGRPLAWGDFDADGDGDVWVAGDTQIFWSQRRQLSWATWPRYGKPLRMALAGSPDGFWGLYASPATASIPSPFGLFLLDPAQGVALGSGILDANGDASASFAVPAQVSLVSPVLYWQGLVGTPLRFTNQETTAFSAF